MADFKFIFTKGCENNQYFKECWKHANVYKQQPQTKLITIRVAPFRLEDFDDNIGNLYKPIELPAHYQDAYEKWKAIVSVINPAEVGAFPGGVPDNSEFIKLLHALTKHSDLS